MMAGESPPSGLPINIVRKDGSRITVRMYTSPLIDQSGQQTGWMTSVTDITEQTRIRQELAQSQERFITVLQALDTAVSVAAPTPTGELLFANQAYKKWFGNSITDGHRYLSAAARGPWADVREVYSEIVERWFEVRIRSIQWVDGRAVELMVATDITQERANQQAQREQHEKLQQTARLVTMGEMASSLAHELNQPLTAIANYTSGAASRIRLAESRGEEIQNEDLIDLLTKTARQAERAGQVIRRIRGFVKRSDPIRRLTDPRTILADSLGLAEIDAREQGIELIQKIPDGLPMLNVDPVLIEQVLVNLVKNGIDAMRGAQRRSLVIEVSLIADQMAFSVIDRGHGVPRAIRDRLFDSFYTTKNDGMGMGLNICRSIIESHQGRLWFEDNPDGGCTFRFTLPVQAEPPPKNTTPESEALKS
jgi:signal transduction histidine kinase